MPSSQLSWRWYRLLFLVLLESEKTSWMDQFWRWKFWKGINYSDTDLINLSISKLYNERHKPGYKWRVIWKNNEKNFLERNWWANRQTLDLGSQNPMSIIVTFSSTKIKQLKTRLNNKIINLFFILNSVKHIGIKHRLIIH